MKNTDVTRLAALCIAALGAGCTNGPVSGTAAITAGAQAGASPIDMTVMPSTSPAEAGAAGRATAGSSGNPASPASTTSAQAGSSASASGGAGTGGSAMANGLSAAGSGGSSAAVSGGAGTAEGGSGVSAGTGGAAGVPSNPTTMSGSQDTPTPMPAPLVWGFGLGISDVPAATKFYTGAMQMDVEKADVKREDRTETTLYSTKAMRGARIVLMNFDDMRPTRNITAKLVWQAQDVAGVNAAASMYPDYVSRLNIGIVQFDGPETYIQEVGNSFDTGGSGISVPYPVAIGFAVSDQTASRKFYTSLGMTESALGTFQVTDATGAGSITEYTVKFDDGMGIVLQQWTPMRNAKDNPIKVVIFVPNAKDMADKITAAGGTIVKQAERTPVYDNRLLVVAKDLDGYILEIVE